MGSSVHEHRFGATPPFTIGVEEEYVLLDPVTLDLVQRADRLLALEDDIELRVMDAVSRLEDAVAIAAYVQGLVRLYCEAFDAGERLPDVHRALATENRWLAARYGLEAPLVDLESGSRIRLTASRLVRRTLDAIEGHARELGSDRELEGIRRILLDGNGADEQLRVFRDTRDVVEVTRGIFALTAAPVLVAA